MKYFNIFKLESKSERFKSRMTFILKECGFALLSLIAGFTVWIILSL